MEYVELMTAKYCDFNHEDYDYEWDLYMEDNGATWDFAANDWDYDSIDVDNWWFDNYMSSKGINDFVWSNTTAGYCISVTDISDDEFGKMSWESRENRGVRCHERDNGYKNETWAGACPMDQPDCSQEVRDAQENRKSLVCVRSPKNLPNGYDDYDCPE